MKTHHWTLFVLILLLCVGCDAPDTQTTKARTSVAFSAFQGAKAGPIDWNLSGQWTVFRFSEEGRPSKLGHWEGVWSLNGEGNYYRNPNEVFRLQSYDGGQILVWEPQGGNSEVFCINEQEYGVLVMTGMYDGERYLAVRREGGKE